MDAWVHYVINTFRNIYGIRGALPLHYGISNESGVHINEIRPSFFDKYEQIDSNEVGWYTWNGTKLPILFPAPEHQKLVIQKENRIIIPHDLIASAFYFLSGWHEYCQKSGSDYDRYHYSDSLIQKLEIVHKPVVNYYFDIIHKALEIYNSKSWTPGRSDLGTYALALTHDIDSLYSGWLEDGFSALKNGQWLSALRIGFDRIRGKDTRFNLRYITNLEEHWNVKGSYYFLTRYGIVNGLNHADYQIDDPRIRSEIAFLMKRGHEVGIHGSKGGHVSDDALHEDIQRLNVSVKGGRYHYLNFDIRKTPGILDRSGLTYDSTLGFGEQIGFRNGLAHPFYLFNLEERKPTNVLEIPLVIMDATLRNKEYMGLKPGESFRVIKPLLQEIEKFNGAAALLWHNGYFTDFKFSGWQEVLEQILNYSKKRGGFICTARRIEQAYRSDNL